MRFEVPICQSGHRVVLLPIAILVKLEDSPAGLNKNNSTVFINSVFRLV